MFLYNKPQFTDEATYSLPYNESRSRNSGRQPVDGELLFVRKTEIAYTILIFALSPKLVGSDGSIKTSF